MYKIHVPCGNRGEVAALLVDISILMMKKADQMLAVWVMRQKNIY